MKRIIFFCFLLLNSIAKAQYTSEINANRPSFSMGAYSVSKSIFQVEAGFGFQKNEFSKEQNASKTLVDFQFRYGAFFEQLEFVADFKYDDTKEKIFNTNQNYNGFQQVTLGAKYMIYDSYQNYVEKINVYSWKANQRYKWRRLVPAVALYVGADFKGNDHYFPENIPGTTLKGMIITQQHINNQLTFVTNLIIENATNDDFRSYGYIATLSYGFSKNWSAFAENQGYFKKYEGVKQSFDDNFILRGGFTYLVNKNLQLDLSGGTTLTNATHKTNVMIGASWRTNKKYRKSDTENEI